MAASSAALDKNDSEEGLYYQTKRHYYLIQQLKLMYSEEVFDYCVGEHRSNPDRLQACMLRQDRIKIAVLEQAQAQLGRRSLAEALYFDCLDFYFGQSIGRTADCVRTRLTLRERLNQVEAETEIYRRCHSKWRKHGARAVNNCAIHAANYYRDKGEFRD